MNGPRVIPIDGVNFEGAYLAVHPSNKSLPAYQLKLERWTAAQRAALGLDESGAWPYQSQGLQLAMSNTPSTDTPDTGGTALSKAQLRDVFRKAHPLAAQGRWSSMPDWTDSPALDALVFHESGRKPGSKNPHSTALGLFQFLDSTWGDYGIAKSGDPVQQAAAGMRYVMSVYGTPERALAFQRGTVNRQLSGIPADLQSKAQVWISKGWSGY